MAYVTNFYGLILIFNENMCREVCFDFMIFFVDWVTLETLTTTIY
jgi:hypothetical protein